ncbi:hypothetical protein R5R35_007252 [Gryllus longicercus]|uniref:Uncharacterized protein n=1 Tax=Gryllus longicercus TaxID=2509291 RepID=A0AAN9ZEB9_9ORTH
MPLHPLPPPTRAPHRVASPRVHVRTLRVVATHCLGAGTATLPPPAPPAPTRATARSRDFPSACSAPTAAAAPPSCDTLADAASPASLPRHCPHRFYLPCRRRYTCRRLCQWTSLPGEIAHETICVMKRL